MTDRRRYQSDGRPRARGLGLPLDGRCGPVNGITDVPGVAVGFTTLIREPGPVRTGVTAVLPRGRDRALDPVWAGFSSFNGNGEMTGSHWIEEAGYFAGPVCITNTHSVGMVHHAVTRWMTGHPACAQAAEPWFLPVVAETCDAVLNDMNGFHVTEDHVRAALETAAAGPLDEGNLGGGTGMICYEFKGGTGSASRLVTVADQAYRLGVLVQANFGRRPSLTVCGVPVGQLMTEDRLFGDEQGSIIVVVATDAPLLPVQLRRVARRAGVGLARTGSFGGNGSGDIFLAFSTASPVEERLAERPPRLAYLPSGALDPLFEATAQAVEEAILNALLGARTMIGYDGTRVAAIDHQHLCQILRDHGRQLASED